ncbi:MAG: NAD-dependent epimerase/dehydratase family protein [bacterium]|nr:NAD-dependent epimerase/dehydratase family protein [bacterium]
MKILITGGQGFLGKHLITRLEADEHDCIFFVGDIRNKADVVKFREEKADIIIHLAAKVQGKDSRSFYEVNLGGTENILEICRQIKPRCFIFLSTIRVLSPQQSPYALSKKAAEEAVIKSGVPYIILRPSLLYGQGNKNNLGFFFAAVARLPIVPIFDFKIQPLFVGDLVEIISRSLEAKTKQIINIIGQETVALSDILQRAKLLLNRQAYILRLPKFLTGFLKLVSLCPYFPFPWWQIQPLLSNEILKSDPWPDLFKIKPTKLDDGLKRTLSNL